MHELRCPSLDYVYDMTWAEFRIRTHAYKRAELNDWYKIREIAWNSLIGFHVNPKKIPKNKEKFMPLEGENTNRKTRMMQAIQKAREEYLNQK